MVTRFHAEAAGEEKYPMMQNQTNAIFFDDMSKEEVATDEMPVSESVQPIGDTQSNKVGENSPDSSANHSMHSSTLATQAVDEVKEHDDNQALDILQLQRSKLDNMVDWLHTQLNSSGFVFTQDV